MSRFATVSGIALSLPILLSFVQPIDDAAFGCLTKRPVPVVSDMPMSLTILNARVVSDSTVQELISRAPNTIAEAEVVCWQAAERLFGVMVQSGVYSMFTKPGPSALLRSQMRELVASQDSYFLDHQVYADEMSELSALELLSDITVDLTANETGWTASGQHRHINRSCHVYGGSAEPPRPGLEPRRPSCVSLHNHGR